MTAATCSLSLECGISQRSCRASEEFRMRVSMSAMGSVIMGSPARLDHAGNLATESEEPEADSAELELAVVTARATADLAAAAMTRRELGSAIEFRELRSTGHGFFLYAFADQAARNGMPSCWRRARPSSSLLAVVTKLMLSPLIASMRS